MPHFRLFVLQVSLVQFLIENCLKIFGEDITSLLGESSTSCDNSENATGTVNNLIGFGKKQTARLSGFMGDA